ncbi:MAG: hypothetical protein WBE13_20630 [Candidatus Acidiferrum sp.]
MTKRLAVLFLFLCASASVAVAQTYDPPASPVAPTSQTQCDKLAQEWSQVSNQIEAAHRKCLEAHHSQAADSATSCAQPACQSLHTSWLEVKQQAAERVQACRAEVAQPQKQPHVGQQVQQAFQPQQTAPEAAAKIAGPLAANETAVAQNLCVIQQLQAAAPSVAPIGTASPLVPTAPQTSTASSPIPPMTQSQLQMLQGLLAANGADNNPNTAALLNALQQTAGQGNLIQQTVNQQSAAIIAIGEANDAARKNAATATHSASPGRTAPPQMTAPNTPGRGTTGVSVPPPAAQPAASITSGSMASGSSSAASGTQGSAPSASGAPRQTFVAFSFSTLGLHGFGGDGAWGIATNNDEQNAINQSGINCASNSQAPNWCGAANGGRYEVCKSDGKTRYVALATNNDGQSIDWSDGESIGELTEADAIKAALANCARSGCQLRQTLSVSCIDDGSSGSDGAGGLGVNVTRQDSDSYAPSIDGSCVHQFWDSTLYGWFAFRNDCGRPISVTYIAVSPEDPDGASGCDIDPGKSCNTGWSKSEVQAKGGGFDVYVCPKGYMPVDAATDQSVDKSNVKFVCKKL